MFYNVDDINIYVRDVNPGGRETIVFVHGWPLAGQMFEYQFNALASAGMRCIAVDLPGYGLSDIRSGGGDYGHQAHLLHRLLEMLGLEGVTLAGFSMGGGIAAKYAVMFGGERVDRLALIGAACPSFVRRDNYPYGMTAQDVNNLIMSVETDKPKAFSDFGRLVFDTPVSGEFSVWFGDMANEAAVLSARQGLAALRDEDLREDIKKINMPTLICHGVRDRVCPYAFAEVMHSSIPGSKLVRFDRSGHDIFFAEKDKLSQELLTFAAEPGSVKINTVIPDDFETMTYEFNLLPLPYAYDALEPHIDARTMHLHHDRHLGTYINNLNASLKDYPAYQNWTLVKLLANLSNFEPPLLGDLQKNAGGVFNHFFYFDSMTDSPHEPSAKMKNWLVEHFGSYEKFLAAFKSAALGVFGSGYAWLVLSPDGMPLITTTANQDCPISMGMYPLLCVDVWEHAYYLKHYNDRAAYLDDFIAVINWGIVEERLAYTEE